MTSSWHASTIRLTGISSVWRGSWACPVCSQPVEVSVRLLPNAAEAAKVSATLRAEHEARDARRAAKRKRGEERGEEVEASR